MWHCWGSLGNDLLASSLHICSAITSSGRPFLTSPSKLATNPTIFGPLALLSFFHGIYLHLKSYYMSVYLLTASLLHPALQMSVD